MWEKFKAQFEEHPYIFGGVALAVVLWVFWPSGSGGGTSSLSATEAQAISDAAQANASLQISTDQMNTQLGLSHDAVTTAGINAATASAINAQNTAAAVQAATIAAGVQSYTDDTAVKLAGISAGAQHDLTAAILASQDSAQEYATKLEMAKKPVQDFGTLGYSGNGVPNISISTFVPQMGSIINNPQNGSNGPSGASDGTSGSGGTSEGGT